jgi:hypothetical protein
MMVFVEHKLTPNFPSLVWGTDIHVEVGPTGLEVSAMQAVGTEERKAAHDPLAAYRHANRSGMQKRRGKNSSHIQFANANDDRKLIRFVKQFGPFVVSSSRTEERVLTGLFEIPIERTFVIARQDLAELRNERRIYRAALALVAEFKRGKDVDMVAAHDCVLQIVDNVSAWPKQWQREKQLRLSDQGFARRPAWSFGQDNLNELHNIKNWMTLEPPSDSFRSAISPFSDPIRTGHRVICDLVNTFPPIVYPWGNTPVEAPGWDLMGGIRPIFYYILRREYLQAGGISICRNSECRELFEIERAGQEFCGDVCSRHQRQREYWKRRGTQLRKRRGKNRKRSTSRISTTRIRKDGRS